MNRMIRIAIAALLGLALGSSPAISAQDKDKGKEKTKRSQTIGAKVFEKLEKAQEAADNNDHKTALSILNELKGSSKLSDYERAMVWNFLGSIRYANDDFKGAIRAFQKVLEQPDIPEAMRTTTTYSVAQLQFADEQYRAALKSLSDWYKLVPEPSPDAYGLEGSIRFQMKDYKGSIKPLLRALKAAKKNKIKFKESWLALLRASYYELGQNARAAKILEILVTLYPKKAYWIQLAGMYGLINREADQLAAMEAAWEQGLLDRESELINLAQLFLVQEVPYKGVRVLEKGIKAKVVRETYQNLRLLAQAMALAQESEGQIPVLERAAEKAPDGEMHLYLAQALLEQAKWKDAGNALERALKKGLRSPGTARVMLGTARYNEGDLSGAREAFTSAQKNKGSADVAGQWLKAVANEEKRREMMAAATESLG